MSYTPTLEDLDHATRLLEDAAQATRQAAATTDHARLRDCTDLALYRASVAVDLLTIGRTALRTRLLDRMTATPPPTEEPTP